MNTTKHLTVNSYIAAQKSWVQGKLTALRDLIRDICPSTIESISYAIPTYKYHSKTLIYFAAFAHHIGLYATPSANTAFAKQLSRYKQGKGSIQLSFDQAFPLDLVRQMIIFKMQGIDLQ